MRPPSRLIIVRRGQTDVFPALRSGLGRWPAGTAVMWDRRERGRRTRIEQVTVDRRQRQRRAEPDAMWYTHGFIVVETTKLPREAIRLQSLARVPVTR